MIISNIFSLWKEILMSFPDEFPKEFPQKFQEENFLFIRIKKINKSSWRISVETIGI